MLEFCAGVLGPEAPLDSDVRLVALLRPGLDLFPKGLLVSDTALQALPAEHADFAFGWV